MAITALPTPPTRSDPDNFASRSDAFMTALPTFATEANALQVDVNAVAVAVTDTLNAAEIEGATQVATATAKALDATNAAIAAANSALAAGAVVWIAGLYAAGDARYSPISLRTYRAKANFTSSLDPSLDSANWSLVSPPLPLNRVVRTSNTIIAPTDAASIIDYTSGTFTQTFNSATALGNGWYTYFKNSGTGTITFDPDGSETINGTATSVISPGELVLVHCDGVSLFSLVLASSPADYGAKTISTDSAAFDAPVSMVQPRTTVRLTTSEQIYTLPDATLLALGHYCDVYNTSGGACSLLKQDGTLFFRLPATNGVYQVWLTDNSTVNGAWAVQTTVTAMTSYAVGTGVTSLVLASGSALTATNFAWTESIALDSTRTLHLLGGDNGSSAYLQARVITVTRTGSDKPVITFGTAVTLQSRVGTFATSGAGTHPAISLTRLADGSFVVATNTNGSGSSLTCEIVAFSVSGSVITYGTPTVLATNTSSGLYCCFAQVVATSTGFVMVYPETSTSVVNFYVRAGTVSGTTITLGAASSVLSKVTTFTGVTLAANADGTALASFFNVQPKCIPLNVSGTTLTVGTLVTPSGTNWGSGVSTASTSASVTCTALGSGKFLVYYTSNSNAETTYGVVTVASAVLTVNNAGTPIAAGSGHVHGNSRCTAYGALIAGASTNTYPVVITGVTPVAGASKGAILSQGLGRLSGFVEYAGAAWLVRGPTSATTGTVTKLNLTTGADIAAYNYDAAPITNTSAGYNYTNANIATVVDSGRCLLVTGFNGSYALVLLDYTIS